MLLMGVLFAGLALGETTIMGGSGNAIPGKPGMVSISIQSDESVSAIQFTLAIPAGVGITGVVGTASSNPDKTVQCIGLNCVLFGLNNTPIPNGVPGTITFATDTTFSQAQTIALTNVLGSSPTGQPVAITSTPITLTVGVVCPDPNGDGITNILDVQLTVNAAIGGQCIGN